MAGHSGVLADHSRVRTLHHGRLLSALRTTDALLPLKTRNLQPPPDRVPRLGAAMAAGTTWGTTSKPQRGISDSQV